MSAALTLGALNPAFAGGPTVVENEGPLIVEAKASSSSAMLIPLLSTMVIIAVVVSGGDDAVLAPSDMRLKQDIRTDGTNHLGLGAHLYRYTGLDGCYEGVIAQEVDISCIPKQSGACRTDPEG